MRGARLRTASVLVLLAVACAAPPEATPPPEPAPPPDTAEGPAPTEAARAWPLEAPPAPEPDPVPPGRAPPSGPYHAGVDVLHYDLELALSDTADWIAGRAVLQVRLTDPVEELRLDFSGLAVEGAWVDGRAASVTQAEGRLRIPLSGMLREGDTARVEIVYGGVPDDGLVLQENLHGRRSAFADNWPDRARYWFPSVDHPSDKATVRFTVHAPARWTVVANGILESEPGPAPTVAPTGEGGRTWRWIEEVPVPTYTMVVGAAELVRRAVGSSACGQAPRAPGGCVATDWYAFPPDTAQAARIFARGARMVELYARAVGPFPYERLSHVQSSTRFGGMENATAIFYPERSLAEGRLSEGTVAHEVAHQWFGDSVTEADWHHLWLSEGFATYWGALFFLWEDGEEPFRSLMESHRSRYLGSDVTDRPVVDPDEEDLFALLNPNNYQKGAWVLHMLRGLLGDEVFNRGVRDYYREHRDGTALTHDFRAALEGASGEDLAWFFRQWIHRPGHPRLEGGWRWDAETGEAVLRIRQVQPESWPTFRLPLEIEARWDDGTRHRSTVDVRLRDQEVRVALDRRPDTLVLDPDDWILKEASWVAEGTEP